MDSNKFNYETNGYLVVPDASLDIEVLNYINASITSILSDSRKGFPYLCFSNYGDKNKLQRITQVHMITEIYSLIKNSSIGKIASEITNSKCIRIWGSQLYIKPSSNDLSTIVGVHNEHKEMPYFEDGILTVWIPLSDVCKNNGTLNYISQSHTENNEVYLRANNTDLNKEIFDSIEQKRIVSVNIGVGGLSFHHHKLLHYSDVNKSESTRMAIAVGLMTDKVKVNTNNNDYGYNEIINSQFYCPVIYGEFN
ncbi:MAG: phytanoyl-CoA dioxygenase family protein [Colwelliaceae bacterium]|nr:phytanoyl-CoA dioxygenase family protein [Colwelliaceae bacterium]